MGAIVAILGEAGDPELEVRLDRMLAKSPYRGKPEKLIEGPLAVGIQSMGWDASLALVGNWIVAFHGYIGNWDDLAQERSWRFRDGASNAEKVAVACDDLGDGLFAKLRGEWAVVIWDRRGRALLAARDVAGCRPLFLQWHGERAFLSSEIRQVLAGSGADHAGNSAYLVARLLGNTGVGLNTLTKNVATVEPGRIYCFRSTTGSFLRGSAVQDYWAPPPRETTERWDAGEAAQQLRDTLLAAVRQSAVSPSAAVTVSGGLDSTTVWAIANILRSSDASGFGELQPISLVFPGFACDESAYIRACLGTDCEDWIPEDGTQNPLELVEPLCQSVDTVPYDTAHLILLLARAVSKTSARVLLTGHGGDYWLEGDVLRGKKLRNEARRGLDGLFRSDRSGDPLIERAMSVGKKGLRRLLNKAFRRTDLSTISCLGVQGRGIAREVQRQVLEWTKAPLGVDPRLFRLLRRLQLGFSLPLWEQLGAAFGVEIRHPLMGRSVVEFAFLTPSGVLAQTGVRKGLLRSVVSPWLPEMIWGRTDKTAFDALLTGHTEAIMKNWPWNEWQLVKGGYLDLTVVARGRRQEYTVLEENEAEAYRLLIHELAWRNVNSGV